MPKNNDRKAKKRNAKKIELRHSRIGLIISFVSVALAIVSFLISTNNENYQKEMEYNQNLPNLSMMTEIIVNDETGDEITRCLIQNDGGIIREAKITPHLFFRFISIPSITSEIDSIDSIYVIEILDMFAPYLGNGMYYSPSVSYNPDEHNWVIDVDKKKIQDTLNLLFRIHNQLEGGVIACEYEYMLEVDYVDIMGDRKTEWYNGLSGILTGIDGIVLDGTTPGFPYQLPRVNEDSWIPLSVYCNAPGINLGEDMEKVMAEIDYLVQLCQEGLFKN